MPMAQNKVLDSRLNDQLQQHYAVNPHPDFLSELKNDVLDHFNGQRQAKTRRYKFAFASIAVVLVLVIVLFATPLGSALAQEFVELFSRAESNVMPNYPAQTAIARDATLAAAPTLTPGPKYTLTPTPTITPGLGDKLSANYSIEEIEQIAGFDVLAPTYLPWPIEFYGASYDPETNIVYLFYNGRMTISQEPITGTDDCDICTEVGANARIRTVQVGDIEGALIYGVWSIKDENKYWYDTPEIVRIRWQTNSTVFQITYGLWTGPLTIDDLIDIAESYQ